MRKEDRIERLERQQMTRNIELGNLRDRVRILEARTRDLAYGVDSNTRSFCSNQSTNELRLDELEAAPLRRKFRNRLARMFQRLAAKLVVTR